MSNTKIKAPVDSKSNIKFLTALIAFIVIVAAMMTAFVVYQRTHEDTNFNWDKSTSAPNNIQVKYIEGEDNGNYISFFTKENSERKLDLYSDPRCPVCARLEKMNGETMKEEVENGKSILNVHLLTFLDSKTNSTYSTDMTASLITLAKNGESEAAWNLYETMWKNQPSERDTKTPKTEYISQVASELGASDKSKEEIAANSNETFIALATASDKTNTEALQRITGAVSTPTLLLNGQIVNNPMKLSEWQAK